MYQMIVEFEDSDVAGLQMKLTPSITMQTIFLKLVLLNQLLACKNASNECELRRRIPYWMLRMILEFLVLVHYEWGSNGAGRIAI
jgi:hypothetical protein